MRFDDPSHVEAWRDTGQFPAIHQVMVQAVREEVDPDGGDVVLDLCSSTGLLARALVDLGYQVAAIEQPGTALDRGRAAGVYDGIPLLSLRIEPGSVSEALSWIALQRVRVVVARRCFPELWDALGPEHFPVFVQGLAAAGVRLVLFEGRKVSQRTVHPLGSAERELAALAPAFHGRVRHAVGRAARVGGR